MKTISIIISIVLLLFLKCSKVDDIHSETRQFDYEVSVNEVFTINLVANPTTGYSWQWVNKQTVTTVDSIDFSYIVDRPGLIGGGGKEIWKFLGVKRGIDTLNFKYCRPWDQNSTVESRKIVINVK